jgi:hypothetical protein
LQNEFAESSEADEAAAEGEHGFVHVGAAFVADEQPFELVEVGEGALDDPADDAEPGAVLGLTAGDQGCDPERSDEPAVLVVVVASVADNPVGSAAWAANEACDGWQPLQQRDQLRDVVAVATGERVGERDPGRIDQEVVLRSGSAPVDRARARRGAPFFACTWLESMIALDHSIPPAARSWASSTACSLSHTLACCHSSRRRQHVYPDPYPSSCGRCIHGIPVCSTNKIPHSASRSGSRRRPGYRERRSIFGKSGSTSSHNSSETIHGGPFPAIGTPPNLTTDLDVLRRQRTGPFILQ